MELLQQYLPNLIEYWPEFTKAVIQTLYMMLISGVIGIIIGLILGVLFVVTQKGGLLENRVIYSMLDKFSNLIRSIPFVILITVLMPVVRGLVGTSVGIKGAIPTLIVGITPFVMRQVAMALSDVNAGLIEAAEAMGLTPFGIVVRVYLKESIPLLVRAITITLVSLLGLTAMAGAIGGGGLGDFVIRYGHSRHFYDITYVSVIVILIMVISIEAVGNFIIKKLTH